MNAFPTTVCNSAVIPAQGGPILSELADDPDFRELVSLFVALIPERRETLCRQFAQQDCAALATTAHQLKGSGGGYGFPGLSAAAAELERACKTGERELVATTFEALLAYMDRISL